MMLHALQVVITRPRRQSAHLFSMLSKASAIPIVFPTLDIRGIEDTTSLLIAKQQLSKTDILIFTSANAVRYASTALDYTELPATAIVMAIGPATEQCLLEHGWHNIIVPSHAYNSEALLALPILADPYSKKITLVCGAEPHPLLATRLRERGATLHIALCYERFCPENSIDALLQQFKQGKVDIIISTSNQSLLNLFMLFGAEHKHWLLATPILVISTAMATTLAEQGYKMQPLVAPNALDSSIMTTLTHWYEEQHYER